MYTRVKERSKGNTKARFLARSSRYSGKFTGCHVQLPFGGKGPRQLYMYVGFVDDPVLIVFPGRIDAHLLSMTEVLAEMNYSG